MSLRDDSAHRLDRLISSRDLFELSSSGRPVPDSRLVGQVLVLYLVVNCGQGHNNSMDSRLSG